MTYKQGVWVFGVVVLTALFASEFGALSHSKLGNAAWLLGLLVVTILSPVWGFCLGRCNGGRGHERMRVLR